MVANPKELRLIATGPAPGGAGDCRNVYHLVTNDAAAAVEADGYFDGILSNGLRAGDQILAAIDIDGAPLLKHYLVTAGGADVAIRGLGAAVAALTFDLVAGADGNALAALPDPADAPATADELREDLVANLIPALRNNLASLASKLEEVRAAITV
jgi:hypothetical protein